VRLLLKGQIGAKRLAGSQAILHYPKDQFLSFLFKSEIQYESLLQSHVLSYIQSGQLVFEIGSNIGQYTLIFSERVGVDGRVVAIEPDSDNFTFLSLNCTRNHCQNVILLHSAVADQIGTSIFYKDTITGGRMSSLIQSFAASHFQGRTEDVSVTTLERLIELYGIPDFVKVDVEGAEDLIFSREATLHDRTVYFVEVRKETAMAIYNKFHSNGFDIFHIENNMKKIVYPSSIMMFANLLIRKANG